MRHEIYTHTDRGGVQLAANADRWHLEDDHVHLSPHHAERGTRLWIEADEMPIVDDTDRMAVVVIDMQNDFCSPGGWTEQAGMDPERCRAAIPGTQRTIEWAREHGLWVIWVEWANRHDLRNLGAPTLYSFKKEPGMRGIGEELEHGRVLLADSWGAETVDGLAELRRDDDIVIDKVRMSGFYGTHLDQVLRTQGIKTLFFTGVNIDQCVTTTMEDAYFRDYNAILVEDATATSSPSYCKEAVVHNAKLCWGFVTDTRRLQEARAWEGETNGR